MIKRSSGRVEVTGEVTMATVTAIYNEGLLPQKDGAPAGELLVDFAGMGKVDSSVVSLMLVWQREAQSRGLDMRFVNVPENVKSLAKLYGVADLISCN